MIIHSDSSYWLKLQPWSAALTVKSSFHFHFYQQSIVPRIFGGLEESNREEERRGGEERHIWTTKGINVWNDPRYAQTKALISSSDSHFGLVVRIVPDIREDHKNTHRHIVTKVEIISEKWSVGCTDWKTKVRTPKSQKDLREDSWVLQRDLWNWPPPHTEALMQNWPRWQLEGKSECIDLQWYIFFLQDSVAMIILKKRGGEHTGLVIRLKAHYYLSNISHTINISMSISAHLRRGIKGTGIFLTKMNAPYCLPPLWPILLEV